MAEKTLNVGTVEIECSVGCGETERVPAFEDKAAKDPAKRIRPVQEFPKICLACWLGGWRSDGPFEGRTWRIYHDGKRLSKQVTM